ncbi:Hypothetical predicted protein [Octopus vulgaris]|uniref:Uncharacterized protein n=1 Tax=Octopus vulgaris TaxID=6645 RepID=A0AA36F096_OCTVU|nr:Hypothetical predicted protein [Octopus vulgaris]
MYKIIAISVELSTKKRYVAGISEIQHEVSSRKSHGDVTHQIYLTFDVTKHIRLIGIHRDPHYISSMPTATKLYDIKQSKILAIKAEGMCNLRRKSEGGLMVWGAVSAHGMLPLVIEDDRSNAEWYIDMLDGAHIDEE